jgi:O-antigen/teichoic acid export membrane protein
LGTGQILLCVAIAATQASTDPLLWFLRGRERLDVEAIIVLIYRLLNAAFLCTVIFFTRSINWLLLGWLASNVVRMACESLLPQTRLLVQSTYRKFIFDFIAIKKAITLSLPVGIAFLLIALYQRLGVFALGIRGDLYTVADYGVAFTLVAPAGFLATSITVSAFPRLVRAVEANDFAAASIFVRKKLMLISAIFVPCCLVGLLVSPIIIYLLYGARYQSAGILMVLMLSGLYISSITFALKYTLNCVHLNWWDAISVSVGIVVFLAITFSAPRGQQAQYAAAAWCIGEGVSFLVKSFALRRDGRIVQTGAAWIFMVFVSILLLSFYMAEYTALTLKWWQGLSTSIL